MSDEDLTLVFPRRFQITDCYVDASCSSASGLSGLSGLSDLDNEDNKDESRKKKKLRTKDKTEEGGCSSDEEMDEARPLPKRRTKKPHRRISIRDLTKGGKSTKDAFIVCINKKLKLSVKNLTTDWSDGTVLAKLVDSFVPGHYNTVKDLPCASDIITHSLHTAHTLLRIPALIQAADIANHSIDDQSMMTYLSNFFKDLTPCSNDLSIVKEVISQHDDDTSVEEEASFPEYGSELAPSQASSQACSDKEDSHSTSSVPGRKSSVVRITDLLLNESLDFVKKTENADLSNSLTPERYSREVSECNKTEDDVSGSGENELQDENVEPFAEIQQTFLDSDNELNDVCHEISASPKPEPQIEQLSSNKDSNVSKTAGSDDLSESENSFQLSDPSENKKSEKDGSPDLISSSSSKSRGSSKSCISNSSSRHSSSSKIFSENLEINTSQEDTVNKLSNNTQYQTGEDETPSASFHSAKNSAGSSPSPNLEKTDRFAEIHRGKCLDKDYDSSVDELNEVPSMATESEVEGELRELTAEVEEELNELTAKVEGELHGLTSEVEDETNELTAEVEEELKELTAQVELNELTAEVKEEFNGLTAEVESYRDESQALFGLIVDKGPHNSSIQKGKKIIGALEEVGPIPSSKAIVSRFDAESPDLPSMSQLALDIGEGSEGQERLRFVREDHSGSTCSLSDIPEQTESISEGAEPLMKMVDDVKIVEVGMELAEEVSSQSELNALKSNPPTNTSIGPVLPHEGIDTESSIHSERSQHNSGESNQSCDGNSMTDNGNFDGVLSAASNRRSLVSSPDRKSSKDISLVTPDKDSGLHSTDDNRLVSARLSGVSDSFSEFEMLEEECQKEVESQVEGVELADEGGFEGNCEGKSGNERRMLRSLRLKELEQEVDSLLAPRDQASPTDHSTSPVKGELLADCGADNPNLFERSISSQAQLQMSAPANNEVSALNNMSPEVFEEFLQSNIKSSTLRRTASSPPKMEKNDSEGADKRDSIGSPKCPTCKSQNLIPISNETLSPDSLSISRKTSMTYTFRDSAESCGSVMGCLSCYQRELELLSSSRSSPSDTKDNLPSLDVASTTPTLPEKLKTVDNLGDPVLPPTKPERSLAKNLKKWDQGEDDYLYGKGANPQYLGNNDAVKQRSSPRKSLINPKSESPSTERTSCTSPPTIWDEGQGDYIYKRGARAAELMRQEGWVEDNDLSIESSEFSENTASPGDDPVGLISALLAHVDSNKDLAETDQKSPDLTSSSDLHTTAPSDNLMVTDRSFYHQEHIEVSDHLDDNTKSISEPVPASNPISSLLSEVAKTFNLHPGTEFTLTHSPNRSSVVVVSDVESVSEGSDHPNGTSRLEYDLYSPGLTQQVDSAGSPKALSGGSGGGRASFPLVNSGTGSSVDRGSGSISIPGIASTPDETSPTESTIHTSEIAGNILRAFGSLRDLNQSRKVDMVRAYSLLTKFPTLETDEPKSDTGTMAPQSGESSKTPSLRLLDSNSSKGPQSSVPSSKKGTEGTHTFLGDCLHDNVSNRKSVNFDLSADISNRALDSNRRPSVPYSGRSSDVSPISDEEFLFGFASTSDSIGDDDTELLDIVNNRLQEKHLFVTDFSKSWSDGRCILALIDDYVPGFYSLHKDNNAYSIIAESLNVAYKHLAISHEINVYDVILPRNPSNIKKFVQDVIRGEIAKDISTIAAIESDEVLLTSDIGDTMGDLLKNEVLLDQFNTILEPYNITVKDFSYSWKSGEALIALVDNFIPGLYNDGMQLDSTERISFGLSNAYYYLNVLPLVNTEEVKYGLHPNQTAMYLLQYLPLYDELLRQLVNPYREILQPPPRPKKRNPVMLLNEKKECEKRSESSPCFLSSNRTTVVYDSLPCSSKGLLSPDSNDKTLLGSNAMLEKQLSDYPSELDLPREMPEDCQSSTKESVHSRRHSSGHCTSGTCSYGNDMKVLISDLMAIYKTFQRKNDTCTEDMNEQSLEECNEDEAFYSISDKTLFTNSDMSTAVINQILKILHDRFEVSSVEFSSPMCFAIDNYNICCKPILEEGIVILKIKIKSSLEKCGHTKIEPVSTNTEEKVIFDRKRNSYQLLHDNDLSKLSQTLSTSCITPPTNKPSLVDIEETEDREDQIQSRGASSLQGPEEKGFVGFLKFFNILGCNNKKLALKKNPDNDKGQKLCDNFTQYSTSSLFSVGKLDPVKLTNMSMQTEDLQSDNYRLRHDKRAYSYSSNLTIVDATKPCKALDATCQTANLSLNSPSELSCQSLDYFILKGVKQRCVSTQIPLNNEEFQQEDLIRQLCQCTKTHHVPDNTAKRMSYKYKTLHRLSTPVIPPRPKKWKNVFRLKPLNTIPRSYSLESLHLYKPCKKPGSESCSTTSDVSLTEYVMLEATSSDTPEYTEENIHDMSVSVKSPCVFKRSTSSKVRPNSSYQGNASAERATFDSHSFSGCKAPLPALYQGFQNTGPVFRPTTFHQNVGNGFQPIPPQAVHTHYTNIIPYRLIESSDIHSPMCKINHPARSATPFNHLPCEPTNDTTSQTLSEMVNELTEVEHLLDPDIKPTRKVDHATSPYNPGYVKTPLCTSTPPRNMTSLNTPVLSEQNNGFRHFVQIVLRPIVKKRQSGSVESYSDSSSSSSTPLTTLSMTENAYDTPSSGSNDSRRSRRQERRNEKVLTELRNELINNYPHYQVTSTVKSKGINVDRHDKVEVNFDPRKGGSIGQIVQSAISSLSLSNKSKHSLKMLRFRPKLLSLNKQKPGDNNVKRKEAKKWMKKKIKKSKDKKNKDRKNKCLDKEKHGSKEQLIPEEEVSVVKQKAKANPPSYRTGNRPPKCRKCHRRKINKTNK